MSGFVRVCPGPLCVKTTHNAHVCYLGCPSMSGLKVVFENAEESNHDIMEKMCHGSCDIMSMHGRCDSMFLQWESVLKQR